MCAQQTTPATFHARPLAPIHWNDSSQPATVHVRMDVCASAAVRSRNNARGADWARLFTELWLRDAGAVAKTDAYDLVKGVSGQTAMKYVRRAIEEGYLEEVANPADGRSRLLRMSPRLRADFEQVIDRASGAFAALYGR